MKSGNKMLYILITTIVFIILLLSTQATKEGLQNHKGWTSQFRIFWRSKISRPFRKTWEDIIKYYNIHIIRPIIQRFG